MPAASTGTHVQLRIVVPEEILDQYQKQADVLGIDVELVAGARLAQCVRHTAQKPLYFDDDERRELERILGKNATTTRDMIVQIRNSIAVKINNLKIALRPALLSRLKSRCLGMQWESFLEKVIVEDLERYVGMR